MIPCGIFIHPCCHCTTSLLVCVPHFLRSLHIPPKQKVKVRVRLNCDKETWCPNDPCLRNIVLEEEKRREHCELLLLLAVIPDSAQWHWIWINWLCLCICAHVCDGQRLILSSSVAVLLDPGDWLAREPSGCSCPALRCWDYRHTPPSLVLSSGAEAILMLAQKALYSWAIFPASSNTT